MTKKIDDGDADAVKWFASGVRSEANKHCWNTNGVLLEVTLYGRLVRKVQPYVP
jgi:hypothetical protein